MPIRRHVELVVGEDNNLYAYHYKYGLEHQDEGPSEPSEVVLVLKGSDGEWDQDSNGTWYLMAP